MRRICPFLLGALLIALICLGGGLHQLDQLLVPVTAWIAGWLPSGLGSNQPTTSALELTSRELAPFAAALCLAAAPLFHRWSLLAGGLAFAGSSVVVLLGATAVSHAGAVVLMPGAPLAAVFVALMTGTLSRLAAAADRHAPVVAGDAHEAALMPPLVEHSSAAILTFDCDGFIRSCNRAFADMFGYAAGDLVGTPFGRLLDVPDHDRPRLFRRSDGPVRALMARRRNGQRIHLHAALSSLEWRGDRLRVAVLHNVSEILADQELSALSDDATGLCNHVLFYDRIDQAILAADRAQQPAAVFIIHLNLFKLIADTLGRPFADELIGLLVDRIQQGLRRSDTLARLGNAELGLLVPGLARPEQAAGSASRIAQLTRQPFAVQGLEVALEVNIGVAAYPQHGHDKHALIQRAEAAMLQARRAQQTVVVPDESPEAHDGEHDLRDDLRAAIEDNLLTIQFLPKLSVRAGRLVGVEALVRWEHPQHGQVPPARFLRLAEESGLILPLTLRVLGLTLDQQRIWRCEGWDLAVAINLANSCLQNPQFPNILAHVLHTADGQADRLVFEITESALTSNPTRVLDTLQRLAGQGCQLSLDDFGTGSFSLSFLRKLPIHELKIDRSFVLAMRDDTDAAAVVRSAISLGKSLDLRVAAEGVENDETLDELRRLQCDEVQGYLIGPPMTADAFASWLQQGGHDRRPDMGGDDRPLDTGDDERSPDTASGAQEPLSAA
jgi:diguanylate cyclase (GGDEF)-like protein/PAS domain S-box-containing protein